MGINSRFECPQSGQVIVEYSSNVSESTSSVDDSTGWNGSVEVILSQTSQLAASGREWSFEDGQVECLPSDANILRTYIRNAPCAHLPHHHR